jgi:hypothetical protein
MEDSGRTQTNVGADGQVRVTPAGETGAGSNTGNNVRAVERVDVSVTNNGQIRLQQQAPRGDEVPTGIMIVEVKQQRGALEVEVADFRRSGSVEYRATLPDGSPLPGWIRVDAGTGKIAADPPANALLIDIRLVAQDPSGSVRTLEIKIDLAAPANRSDAGSPAPQEAQARPSFMRQIDAQNQNWDGYGTQVLSVFSEQPLDL